MNSIRSLIGSLSDETAFKIFTDGEYYFIPGQKEDSPYDYEFDALSVKYFPYFDRSLGAGWLFDKEGIEKIKHIFDHDSADYAEISIKSVSFHRHR